MEKEEEMFDFGFERKNRYFGVKMVFGKRKEADLCCRG
jgi:hypothetical protein